MKRALIGAALFAALAAPVMAGGKGHHHKNYGSHSAGSVTIVVSCYRGPWQEVIWDRPNPVFIDTLVQAGYDYPNAHAIAERVCRDPTLVNNPGSLRATMQAIYRDANSHRRHNR
ncbi:hypothetical protein PGB28_16340 [Primorskyibacter aestuariivivens]|uniref:hypothetical protein n=1 Tax=Primorskyibacter aestuariivivens TaxID=1888912 RepID=UPI002301C710|nr:hypothetical protein [Primorskyibacter aestuariivivens]MDA7430036.1 hypothetical protein [Primorskyibacter aestuariivivens]